MKQLSIVSSDNFACGRSGTFGFSTRSQSATLRYGRIKFCATIVGFASLFGAQADQLMETNGWKAESPREEIRPAFEFKAAAGTRRQTTLVIEANEREGVDGHWTKTFPVRGGQHYRFRALRRVENVPWPRRSTFARVLWHDAHEQPVNRDEPGA